MRSLLRSLILVPALVLGQTAGPGVKLANGGGGASIVPVVSAGTTTSSTIPFSWAPVSGATSYDWRDTPSGGSASGWTNVSSGTTSATATGLTASTSYLIEVRANVQSANGSSTASTQASTSPTIPFAHEVVGKNLDLQTQNYSIGTLTSAFAGGSQSAMTFAQGMLNETGRTATKIRLLFPVSAASGNAVIAIRVAVGSGPKNPTGSWAQVKWGGANSITPANGSWSYYAPNFVLSDTLTVPGGIPSGSYLVIWTSLSGGSSLVGSYPSHNTSAYASYWAYGDFAGGDYASAGSSGSPTWTGVNPGGIVSHVDWWFGSGSATINAIAMGDSRRAQIVPVTPGTTGNGWCEKVNALARAGGKNFRITSGGQGTFTMSQTFGRFANLLASGVATKLFDVIDYEDWSWNDRLMGTNGQVATNDTLLAHVQDSTSKYSLGLVYGQIAPPGQGDPNGTIPTDLASIDNNAYDSLTTFPSAHLGAQAYNVQSSIWASGNHRQHASTASSDNVHDYIGAAGQDLVGAAVYAAYPALLTAQGYSP